MRLIIRNYLVLFFAFTLFTGSYAQSIEQAEVTQIDSPYIIKVMAFIKQEMSEPRWEDPLASYMKELSAALEAAQLTFEPKNNKLMWVGHTSFPAEARKAKLFAINFNRAVRIIIKQTLNQRPTSIEKFQLYDSLRSAQFINIALEEIQGTFKSGTYPEFLKFVTLILASKVKIIRNEDNTNKAEFEFDMDVLEREIETDLLPRLGASFNKSLDTTFGDIAKRLSFKNFADVITAIGDTGVTDVITLIRDYAYKINTPPKTRLKILMNLLKIEQLDPTTRGIILQDIDNIDKPFRILNSGSGLDRERKIISILSCKTIVTP